MCNNEVERKGDKAANEKREREKGFFPGISFI
jgi:hypothetical protein